MIPLPFGLSGIKIALFGLAALAVVSIIGFGYLHYSGLVEDNARLRENEAKLMLAIETERQATLAALDAVGAWKENAEEFGRQLEAMALVQRQATAQTRKLNDLFAEHDLGALARARPGLIQRRVNAGTAAALRVLECATGGGTQCADQGGPADGPPAAGPGADPDDAVQVDGNP